MALGIARRVLELEARAILAKSIDPEAPSLLPL